MNRPACQAVGYPKENPFLLYAASREELHPKETLKKIKTEKY